MKKILLVSLIAFSLIAFNACSSNLPSNSGISANNSYDPNNPWDYMSGGGIGEDTSETGSDMISVSHPISLDSGKLDTDSNEAISIDLNNLSTSTDYYKYENDELTIQVAGIYELSGTLNGIVSVKKNLEDTRIILNGVTIIAEDNQADAPITFKENTSLRVLTIKENTVNTLKDSSAGTEACLAAKKSSLTINGTGTLNLVSQGNETAGIKVKNNLDIIGTTINISASKNGIKANEQIYLQNSSINVEAKGDGIKTDIEATTNEEADEFTKDPYKGYIYIENSNLDIVSGDDGICANSLLYINNNDSNLIKIKTNNGAPNVVTEYSSDKADGKALKTGGIAKVLDDVETDLLSQCDDNYRLIINGGRFELDSNSDAITSKGNVIINGGKFNIATGDDAIHAEYLNKIIDGDIKITKSYEGIEGASVEIYGGKIDLVATDDGINAANGDLKNYSFNIYIGGGDILVNAQGDGVDSNGTIEFSGGKTVIYGPTANDNAALDADKGILINSGYVFAFGASGMLETPSSNSKQASIIYNSTSSISANSTFKLLDNNDEVLYEMTPTKQYQSVIVSVPELVNGSTFKIVTGSTTNSVTISGILNQIGKTFGPGGFGGNNGHGPR